MFQPETSAIRDSYLQAAQFVGRNAELQQLTAALSRRNTMPMAGCGWLVAKVVSAKRAC